MRTLLLIAIITLTMNSCAWGSEAAWAAKHARCASLIQLMGGEKEWHANHIIEALKILDEEEIMYQAGYVAGIVDILSDINKMSKRDTATKIYLDACSERNFKQDN